MKPAFTLFVCMIAVLAMACSGPQEETARAPVETSGDKTASVTYRIAVIPKGTTHTFWKSIHAGARKAGKETNAEIFWLGPEKEDDRKAQIEIVQNFISRGVDAIVLAPLDDTALVRPVETAKARGIPVVIIDSSLNSDAYVSFVATDNREGGRMGARRLGELMGGAGSAMMLRYSEGSASTVKREAGFMEEMQAKSPNVTFLSTNQYGGATKESAMQASQNLLIRFGDRVNAIFTPNESTTFGMLRALENAGRTDEIRFVGFDTSPELIAALRERKIQGLVAQDPFDMGYNGVKAAVDAIEGREVPRRIATRLEMITPDNVDSPDIQELIQPELDRWLSGQ